MAKKVLSVFCIIAATVISVESIIDDENNNYQEICQTPGCIKAANDILYSLDESVNPCENFYEFACGNFLNKTSIPDDKSIVTSFSIAEDIVQEQLRTILNEKYDSNEAKPYKLAKDFNAACLNKEIIEERGIKPLQDIFEMFGGWPVVKGDLWNEGNWEWIDVLKKFRRMGFATSILFRFTVDTDLRNSSTRILEVSVLQCGSMKWFLK